MKPDAPTRPEVVELEQALIGAVLVQNDAYYMVSSYLFPRHFAEPLHQILWKAISLSVGRGRPATPATLYADLKGQALTGAPPDFSLSAYIARMAAEATTIMNVPDFGRRILETAAERDLMDLATRMTEAASAGGLGAPLVAAQVEAADAGLEAIRKMLVTSTGGGVIPVSDAAARLVERINEVDEGHAVVPSTGLADIDHRLAGGFNPNRLTIVGGRPGMGKTVLMTEMIRRVAVKGRGAKRDEERYASGFVTLEVDAVETSARIMAGGLYAGDHKIAYRDIVTGLKGVDHRDRLVQVVRQAQRNMEGLPLYIDHAPGASIAEIRGRVRLMKERARRDGYTLVVVAIDYLGLIAMSERYRGNRVAELGEVVLGTKRLSEEEGLHVVLGAQLNRQVENRDDKRPQLADLRESGNIEEHADNIILLYRPLYYIQRTRKYQEGDAETLERAELKKFDLEANVEKARLGGPGVVRLFADVACSHIANGDRYGK